MCLSVSWFESKLTNCWQQGCKIFTSQPPCGVCYVVFSDFDLNFFWPRGIGFLLSYQMAWMKMKMTMISWDLVNFGLDIPRWISSDKSQPTSIIRIKFLLIWVLRRYFAVTRQPTTDLRLPQQFCNKMNSPPSYTHFQWFPEGSLCLGYAKAEMNFRTSVDGSIFINFMTN